MYKTPQYLGERIWILNKSKLYKEKTFQLDWLSLFDFSLGTRKQNQALILSAQEFFLANWGSRGEQGWILSPNAMQTGFEEVQVICRWMTNNSIWKFSEISIDHVISFLQSRRSSRPRKDDAISEKYFKRLSAVFQSMWDKRGRYRDSIQLNVSDFKEALILNVQTRPDRPWIAIEEKISLDLLHAALDLIDRYGAYFLELNVEATAFYKSRDKFSKPYLFDLARTDLYRKAVTHELFAPLYQKMKSGRPGDAINLIRTTLEGACAYVLLLLLGMRASELLALDFDCISIEKSEDGSIRTYVNGPAAKKNGLDRKWVAGDIAIKIINFLIEWYRPDTNLKKRSQLPKALFLTSGSRYSIPGEKRRRWTATSLNKRIKRFVSDEPRLTGVSLSGFHVHRTRKSFAQLAVLRNKSILGAVAAQFGHAYKEFTDQKYVGNDYELTRMLRIADRQELARGLEHILTSNHIAGKAVSVIQGAREKVARFSGKKALAKFIDELINRGVTLAPCDWGYCVYSRAHSACEGDKDGPNEILRSPDVCSGCQNFVATRENLPWWEARVEREDKFLRTPDLSRQSLKITEQRLQKSKYILLTLISPTAKVNSNGE